MQASACNKPLEGAPRHYATYMHTTSPAGNSFADRGNVCELVLEVHNLVYKPLLCRADKHAWVTCKLAMNVARSDKKLQINILTRHLAVEPGMCIERRFDAASHRLFWPPSAPFFLPGTEAVIYWEGTP